MAASSDYFPRAEFALLRLADGRTLSQVALDYLANRGPRLTAAASGENPGGISSEELSAEVAALREEIARAVATAVAQAHILDLVPPTTQEILAITDLTIKAETGDALLAETFDALLMEAA